MRKFPLFLTVLLPALLLTASAQTQPAQTAPKTAPAAKPSSSTTSPKSSTQATKPRARTSASAKSSTPLKLETQEDKFSYALGMNLGSNLHKQSVPINPDVLVRGLKDALGGGKTQLSEQEARAALMAVQLEMRHKMEAMIKQQGDANRKEGDAFLAANKNAPGVVTLPSGLEYKVLKEGTGPKPAATDTVVCNYRGSLINGTEFDSSYKRGEAATFPVSGVIKGWTEALQLMPVGSKWQLFVPAELAYGERAPGDEIGPNSTLIFEVELLSIEQKKPEETPGEGAEQKTAPEGSKPAQPVEPKPNANPPENKPQP